MEELTLDTIKDSFDSNEENYELCTSKDLPEVGQKESSDKVKRKSRMMTNGREFSYDKLTQANKKKPDLDNHWEKGNPGGGDQCDQKLDSRSLRSFGTNRPVMDGRTLRDEFKNFSTCKNSFEGRMRSEFMKNNFKDQLGNYTDQGLASESNSRMKYCHSNRGRQMESPRQEIDFGMKNGGKSSLENGSSAKNYQGNRRKYTFEEFTRKLFNGKIPTSQPVSGDGDQRKYNFPVNQKIRPQQDDKSESVPALSNVRGKGNMIPGVLLIGKRNKHSPKKKAAIENEELDIVEDKFVSFDTDESSDESEFFTPNTSMDEADSGGDSETKCLVEENSYQEFSNTPEDLLKARPFELESGSWDLW